MSLDELIARYRGSLTVALVLGAFVSGLCIAHYLLLAQGCR